jgi:hypothetical protein
VGLAGRSAWIVDKSVIVFWRVCSVTGGGTERDEDIRLDSPRVHNMAIGRKYLQIMLVRG